MASKFAFNPFTGKFDITLSTPIDVGDGGTGNTSFTAYSVILGGTTSTGAYQNVSGVGSSGQVLTSNGPGLIPSWQPVSAGLTSPEVLARTLGS